MDCEQLSLWQTDEIPTSSPRLCWSVQPNWLDLLTPSERDQIAALSFVVRQRHRTNVLDNVKSALRLWLVGAEQWNAESRQMVRAYVPRVRRLVRGMDVEVEG